MGGGEGARALGGELFLGEAGWVQCSLGFVWRGGVARLVDKMGGIRIIRAWRITQNRRLSRVCRFFGSLVGRWG
jgi:hypothetical protein